MKVMIQIVSLLFVIAKTVIADDDLRNHKPSDRNNILSIRDVADHWVGMQKSQFGQFTVTVNPMQVTSTIHPTSAPVQATKVTKNRKKKRRKKINYEIHRNDEEDYQKYASQEESRSQYPDGMYDYDSFDPMYTPKSPYIMKASASKSLLRNVGSGSGIKAVYAASPKIAKFVVREPKTYVVRRVKAEPLMIAPSVGNNDMFASGSSATVRRLDSDYEDPGSGGPYLNMGPQDGFPPRQVMSKITQPGQSQPCHGPECHQHHKGLVRFYWRRVVYPPGVEGNPRGRNRFRRPTRTRTRGRGRRLRNRGRAPSDQREFYQPQDDQEEDDGDEDVSDSPSNFDEDEDDDSEDQQNSDHLNVWKPGNAYGHDLGEGSNYSDHERKLYRDKRYAYMKWMRDQEKQQK